MGWGAGLLKAFRSRAVGRSRFHRHYSAHMKAQDSRKHIRKLLIANRGEIACRIINSARKLGLQTVAIYSDVDRHALHVQKADEAVFIGPAPAQLSYLNGSAILEAALRTHAHAIHPGYGFLSENAQFAELCEEQGVTFVGPPASAIRAMGDKSASKRLMGSAGVPVVPGYHGEEQNVLFLKSQADLIGYPIIIKATQGGGGKGMKIVSQGEEFSENLNSAQREAAAAFGDSRVLIEKYISQPRHVEVQIFGDMHGNVLHLFERDCSVQRRHQKIIEEAPAPNVTDQFREEIGQAAVNAAKAVGYYNAGTVEFIVDTVSGEFYFMEMNTRLQVEHPVTEMVTKQDLVEWQIRVANGEALPVQQSQLSLSGHAFEVRIYAENVSKGFLPAAGVLHHYHPPFTSPTVRVETGVQQGDAISVHYDPMIAKLVVWGHNRSAALVKLQDSLSKFQIAGVPTNIALLKALARHPAFAAGKVETHFIEHYSKDLLEPSFDDSQGRSTQDSVMHSNNALKFNAAIVAVCLCMKERWRAQCSVWEGSKSSRGHLWSVPSGFRINHAYTRTVQLHWNEAVIETHCPHLEMLVTYRRDGGYDVEMKCEDFTKMSIMGGGLPGNREAFNLEVDGVSMHAFVTCYKEGLINHVNIWHGDNYHHFFVSRQSFEVYHDTEEDSALKENHGKTPGVPLGAVVAPMAGCIVKIFVEDGGKVKKGEPLLIMEAMKMEHVVRAPRDGLVHGMELEVGQQVKDNSVLMSIDS